MANDSNLPNDLYKSLRARGDFRGQKNDCAVIATAVVTGTDYDTAYDALKAQGRKDNKGPTYDIIRTVLKSYGLILIDMTDSYLGRSVRALGPLLPQDGVFLIAMNLHVSAVLHGRTEDWAKDKKRTVEKVWQVVAETDPRIHGKSEGLIVHERKRNVVIQYEKPTKAVWIIADILYNNWCQEKPDQMFLGTRRWWGMFRAQVSAECQANGINETTAAVQTSKWMADRGIFLRNLK